MPVSISLLQALDLDHRPQRQMRKPESQDNNSFITAKACENYVSENEQVIQTLHNYRFNKVHSSS